MANSTKQQTVRVVETPNGDVRITQPKGRRRTGVNILLQPDDLVREQMGGFANFLKEYAVVGLAIGFIIGLQAQALVRQLVDSFVTPLLTLLVGESLQSKKLVVHGAAVNAVTFAWGKFLYVLIDFLFVMLFIYLIVKLFRLDKFRKQKEEKK